MTSKIDAQIKVLYKLEVEWISSMKLKGVREKELTDAKNALSNINGEISTLDDRLRTEYATLQELLRGNKDGNK